MQTVKHTKYGHPIAKVSVCVHNVKRFEFSGDFQTAYMEHPMPYVSMVSFINKLDQYFNDMDFPQAFTRIRSFKETQGLVKITTKKEVEKLVPEEIIINRAGEKATFVIQVLFRQNSSWQGTITWNEKKITKNFRSTLELIKLMDSAMEETGEEFENWKE